MTDFIGSGLPPDRPPASRPAVRYREDCGNAPRKRLLLDLAAAFAEGDLEPVTLRLHDGIVWKRAGRGTLEGKAAVVEALEGMKEEMMRLGVEELRVDYLLTHGNEAAMNGLVVPGNHGPGSSGARHRSFCALVRFAGHSRDARIRELTTYLVETEEEGGMEWA